MKTLTKILTVLAAAYIAAALSVAIYSHLTGVHF